ncbi:MAG: ChbG/HpnK family deacetylase [Mucilaginibacter sp.]
MILVSIQSINKAILYCFENGIINSTSLLSNTTYFEEAVELIHKNPIISNVGVHINLSKGKPVTSFDQHRYLDKKATGILKKREPDIISSMQTLKRHF